MRKALSACCDRGTSQEFILIYYWSSRRMSSSLRENDDDRLRHLHDQVLPWLIGGLRARRQWFVYAAKVHSYATEILTLLAGLGFAPSILSGLPGVRGTSSSIGPAVAVALGTLAEPWLWVGIVATALWVLLRVVVSQNDVRQRALFALDCARSMELFHTDLHQKLDQREPSPDIAQIQRAVNAKVKEAVNHNVWPWSPPRPKSEDIAMDLARETDYIRTTYMARWSRRDREPPDHG
jgi:hypothetical protein